MDPRKGGSRYVLPRAVAAGVFALAGLLTVNVPSNTPVSAYEPNDYASETVKTVIQSLKDASGNVDSTVKAYEEIAAIISEGKGVGGSINYRGVQLERGFVADEDTAIYNPGLTLLTESEKDRLVEAVVAARRDGLAVDHWNTDTQAGFDYLREKLDPLHMYELRGYLKIVPFLAGTVYLGALAVQQLARDLFPAAYFAGVLIIFGPAIALILAGPQ
jgi:hypothetical protein